MDTRYSTPILFIIFNRPDTARLVFNEIKKQRPKQLFVAADGPRASHPDDIRNCRQSKELLNEIDWECDVKTFFRETNVGCGYNVAASISWFFSHVDKGIILEDDIIPHPDFFPFCTEMLDRYEHEDRIVAINGFYGENISYNQDSYFFRCSFSGWGWATWKNVWERFDLYLDDYTREDLEEALKWAGYDLNERRYKRDQYFLTKARKADSWDWQFRLYILKWKSLVLTPRQNMVKNIGYGDTSSHFKGRKAPDHVVHPIYPLQHPQKIERIVQADLNQCRTITVTIPVILKSITVRNNWLWWVWRWFRRHFVAKPKYGRPDEKA